MTIIITHGDADGICAAAIVKMTPEHHKDEVFFSHPMGLLSDLSNVKIQSSDLILLDIAIDQRAYSEIIPILERIGSKYTIIYLDHHDLPGPLPSCVKMMRDPTNQASATELAFRFFYSELPVTADRITCIGAICDYCDDTPLIKELMHRFERRTLFLDAGIMSQGMSNFQRNYDFRRKLVEEFAKGRYPCEISELTNGAIKLTQEDKKSRSEVIKMYEKGEKIAWVFNPPASKSKAAHWIMGDSGKLVGITVNIHQYKPDIADITIRGRNVVDLRPIIPKIAQTMGGSGGGHENAIGCRIPRDKLDTFLKIFDRTLSALELHLPPSIPELVDQFK
jgi:RecJ-like exonuclease